MHIRSLKENIKEKIKEKVKIPKYGTKEWFEFQFSENDSRSMGGDNWGHRWRGSQQFRHRFCYEIIDNYVNERTKGLEYSSILDIACGFGEFTELMDSVKWSHDIYVTDISENAISYVKNKYKKFIAQVAVLPEINFPHQSMDIVTCLEVLHYLNKQQFRQSLDNINDILKPDGLFLVSGCINAGDRYFNETEFINGISERFSIIEIDYLYNYLEDKFESPFLRILGYINIAERVLNKKIIVANFFKIICKSEWRAKIFNIITKMIWPEKGKTHVIVLCTKKESVERNL